MLGSIEKGRKLPQLGRRHNVAFFNKMHPLSRLAQCNPTEHFIVFCYLPLPAWEGSWHSVPEVTKSLCVHTLVFTFLRGFEGRAALLFFSSPVTNGLWQAPRRSEQKLLELVGIRSATCPWGWGQGGRKWFCMKASSEDTPLSPAEAVTFQRTSKRPWLEEYRSSEGRRTLRGSTRTGHRSLLTPQLLARVYSGFHNVPANQVGGFCNERTFF